jgi:hypothetical protein
MNEVERKISMTRWRDDAMTEKRENEISQFLNSPSSRSFLAVCAAAAPSLQQKIVMAMTAVNRENEI